jgi:hypothetical protein
MITGLGLYMPLITLLKAKCQRRKTDLYSSITQPDCQVIIFEVLFSDLKYLSVIRFYHRV